LKGQIIDQKTKKNSSEGRNNRSFGVSTFHVFIYDVYMKK